MTVEIIYTGTPGTYHRVSGTPAECLYWFARAVRDWIIDEDVKIVIDGEEVR